MEQALPRQGADSVAPPVGPASPRVTVLIPTHNEEKNLPEALASARWADQIVVVDSFSTDTTMEIASAATPHVFQHAFENYSAQKNWALDTLPIEGDWVFILDADERFTQELEAEVRRVAADPDACDGYYVNRRFIFMGRWIRHCGWYPSWNLRLFRHGRARYDGRAVHEHMIVEGSVGYLQHDLVHEDRRGLDAFLARHNRYSTMEAMERLARLRGERIALTWKNLRDPVKRKRVIRERLWPWVPFKPAAFFFYMYVWRLGFLDGMPGFWFSVLQAIQEFHTNLKVRELRRSDEK